MIPNQKSACAIEEVLTMLSQQGLDELAQSLEKLFNELMKIERENVLQVEPYERSDFRKGYANGFKDKMLQTRVGSLHLRVPQTRNIPFYPSCLEKGERTEKALNLAVAEMYLNGVSTRKVKKITQELCGMEISSTQVSRVKNIIDEELEKFRNRPLGECPYIYLDADYQKVRRDGHVRDAAVLKLIGVNKEGTREVLSVSCSLSEAEVHWRTFLENALKRGLKGVQLVISDDHPGLRAAMRAVLPSVPYQRCLFHLSQNAQNHAPSRDLRAILAQEVRDIYSALDAPEAERRVQAVIKKYEEKASHFCKWLEENFIEGLTFLKFPRAHWKKIRTVNLVERLNREVKRRTRVIGLFPNEESCLRLITSLMMDVHEEWATEKKYLTFEENKL